MNKDTKKYGLLPAVKSFLFGDLPSSAYDGNQQYVNADGGNSIVWQLLTSTHLFDRKSLMVLVEMGYTNSPAGFGIINKILLAQRNINFVPYWKGTPYKSKKFTLDANFALQNLLTTGTVIIYEKEIIGFPSELVVLNTLDIEETYVGGTFSYRLYKSDGSWLPLDNDKMIIIKIFDAIKKTTQMGLSPFQAALMPLESLREMYIADTSTLKNKGADILLTNDSDSPIIADERGDASTALNLEIGGARNSGKIAVTTSKLRAVQLGKTTKELALWDGYAIKLRDLCNVLQVDSGQFNDPGNKKFANVLESNKALYNDCVIPFTKLITENAQLKNKLQYDIFLDLSGIDCLQISQNTRAEKANTITNAIVSLNTQIKNGTITPDIAINILVSEWGFDQAEATKFIMPLPAQAPATPPTDPNTV